MQIEQKTIEIGLLEANKGQLKGLPKNPRIIKDNRFKALKQSIKDSPEFIELRELLVYPLDNGKYIVIAGSQRLTACIDLKFKEVPCKVLPKSTTIEKLKEYTIKDNVSFGEMDWEAISMDWSNLDLDKWGEDVKDWDLTPVKYSTKNTEVDINKVTGTHTIKLTLSKEDWDKIKNKVQQSNKTNEEIYFSAAIQL